MSMNKSQKDKPHIFLNIHHQITDYNDTAQAFLEESDFIDKNGPRANSSKNVGYLTIGRELGFKHPQVDLELPSNNREIATQH